MREQYEIRWTDYYALLQVQPDAEMEVIEGAYKYLMRKYHPDRNPDSDATEKVKLLNEAREILADPERRAQYDEVYRQHKPARRANAPKGIRQARKRLQTEKNPRLERTRAPHLLVHPNEIDFGIVDHGETKTHDVRIRVTEGRLMVGDLSANRPWIKLSTTELFSKNEVIQVAVDTHNLEPGHRYTGAVMVKTISYGMREIPISLEIAGAPMASQYNANYWRLVLSHLEPRTQTEQALIADMSSQLAEENWRPNSKQLALIERIRHRQNGKK